MLKSGATITVIAAMIAARVAFAQAPPTDKELRSAFCIGALDAAVAVIRMPIDMSRTRYESAADVHGSLRERPTHPIPERRVVVGGAMCEGGPSRGAERGISPSRRSGNPGRGGGRLMRRLTLGATRWSLRPSRVRTGLPRGSSRGPALEAVGSRNSDC
jgi:hypothetical protein